MDDFGEIIRSTGGDVLTLILFLSLAVVVLAYGLRYAQWGLIAQFVPLLGIVVYYFSALIGFDRELMHTGFLRSALILFALTYLAYLTRFDPAQTWQNILDRLTRWIKK